MLCPCAREGFSCILPPGGLAGWASHELRLGERRSSSGFGDNQDFKRKFLKKTSVVTLADPRTLRRRLIGIVSLGPTCARSSPRGGRRRLPAPEALGQCKPQDLPATQLTRLLLVAQNSGMKCSAGARGARSLQVPNQPLEERPPSGCDRAHLPLPLPTSHRLWNGVGRGCSPFWYNIGSMDITQIVHIGSV